MDQQTIDQADAARLRASELSERFLGAMQDGKDEAPVGWSVAEVVGGAAMLVAAMIDASGGSVRERIAQAANLFVVELTATTKTLQEGGSR